MKIYSHALCIAALSLPAFCQVKVQVDALSADAAAQLEKTTAQLKSLEKQLVQFDSSDLQEKLDKAASKIDEARNKLYFDSADKFDSSLIEKYLQTTQTDLNEKVSAKLDSLRDKFTTLSDRAFVFNPADSSLMALLQRPPAPAAPSAPAAPPAPAMKVGTVGRMFGRDGAYDAGTRALDQHNYDEAVADFDMVVTSKSSRCDGALYWKAYALNRAGKRDDALAAIAQLRRDYATSAWLNDAQVLEADVRRSNGQPISPEQEGNEDLKLMAINSLISADAERAIPLIEGILKSNSTPKVKRNALFVLAQSKSARAQQALLDAAKGGINPDLQTNAIQFLGQSSTKEAQQQLASIYSSSSDARVKSAILSSLMSSKASDAMLSIAKSEKDPALRSNAVRYLASMKTVPVEGLMEIYNSGADAQTKKDIISGLMSRHDAKSLIDMARKENDPAMKRTIVNYIASMHDNKEAMDYMIELLK